MRAIRRIQPSIFFSILVHGAFLLAWFLIASDQATNKHASRAPILIEVEPLNKSKVDPSSIKNQVVQTERATLTKTAAPDAFLGEKTQTVDRQTISMPKVGTAVKTAKAQPAAKAAESSSQEKETKRSATTAQTKTPLIQATGALAKFGIAVSAGVQDSPKPQKQNILQDASLTAQARGEYVKGFKAGEETMLNTREFVFYGYFQRIRERLDRAWDQSLRARLTKYFYRGRQLASETDYMTQLLVVLDPEGKITKVQIIGASGTNELDEAAIKAFNDAGPFPNPPKGLVDGSGHVLVRWDFVLKT